MPTQKLNFGQKVSRTFLYPESGKVRFVVEADAPVDIFVSTPQVAEQISSVPDAAKFVPNIMIYTAQVQQQQIITLPSEWKSTGWTLTIGHRSPNQEPIAVHYEVYPA